MPRAPEALPPVPVYLKEGKVAFYSLDDDHIRNLMEECVKHVSVE